MTDGVEVAVVEDEPEMMTNLSRMAGEYFTVRNLAHAIHLFANADALFACGINFDLIFLDIGLNGMSGMEAARKLREQGRPCFLLFVTALSEYVYDAFDVEASGYLLKPLDQQRFERAMDRVCQGLARAREQNLVIPMKGNYCKSLAIGSIRYCEAVNHKVEVHADQTVYPCRLKLEDLEQQLGSRFFRCHRSYLVSLDYVCGYEDGFAVLKNAERIPVSRLRGREFSQAVLRYMEGKYV